jgi:cell wall-associated NlpC family hydrolase
MIQKTIRRVGLMFPIVVFAMLFIAATSNESAARTHKTGRHGMIGHPSGKHGKLAQNARHHHGKHFARLSRHHVPQRALTSKEKEDIVQKIRTLATSSAGTDEVVATTTGQPKTSIRASSKDDSVIAAETSSPDVQAQIAEAAKEERAEDNVDVSLDKYFKARPDASASATSMQSSAMADALNPAAEVERQQDFTLSDENDPNRAAQRSDVMAEIITWIGTRYEFGGEDRGGIDCSSFTKQVFEKAFGLDLPRTAYGQSQLGDPVTKDELQFGDLVFFKTARYAPITHVGIYIGEGLFANAACSRGVTVASLESEYWSAHYVGARRLLANSGTASLNGSPSNKAMAARVDGSSN